MVLVYFSIALKPCPHWRVASPNSVWTGLKYDFEYENFMSLNCQCIQRYYWSSVGREDAEKALALLELLFVRSGRISAE